MNSRDRRASKRHAYRMGLKSAARWWGWRGHGQVGATLAILAAVEPKHRGNPWAKSRFNLRMGAKVPMHIAQADGFDAGWEAFKP
jgi:hypothetical protein